MALTNTLHLFSSTRTLLGRMELFELAWFSDMLIGHFETMNFENMKTWVWDIEEWAKDKQK